MVPLSHLCLLCRRTLMVGQFRWSRRYYSPLLLDGLARKLENRSLLGSRYWRLPGYSLARTAIQDHRQARSGDLPERLSNFHSDTVITADFTFVSCHARQRMGTMADRKDSGNLSGNTLVKGVFEESGSLLSQLTFSVSPCLIHTMNIAGTRNCGLVLRHSQVASNP